MHFPVSGVDVAWWIPPAVAFGVSCFTSMGGVSGAFLLLPFQVSVLGFTSPAVTPTNHLFNVVAIPSGVYRYIREGRMAWPVTWVIIAGTLPGVIVGSLLRIHFLPDPRHFKLFVGCVLLYLGGRLLYENLLRSHGHSDRTQRVEEAFRRRQAAGAKCEAGGPDTEPEKGARVVTLRFTLREVEYRFFGESFRFSTPGLFLLTLIVGVVGGTYGIGGGAIIAPFLVAFYRLPVYTIAGSALLGTCLTSIVGVLFFTLVAPLYRKSGVQVSPDWILGLLFGAGGFLGMYVGARMQRFVPARAIKVLLGLLIAYLSVRYVLGFYLGRGA
ncbi:MAG: sulfite exporter TauE/SafE family protein [Planctomycetota bacterium]